MLFSSGSIDQPAGQKPKNASERMLIFYLSNGAPCHKNYLIHLIYWTKEQAFIAIKQTHGVLRHDLWISH